MAKILKLDEITDARGSLRVIDNLPFAVCRIYFIDGMNQDRGGHRHKETRQIMICARGSVSVYMNDGRSEEIVELIEPTLALLIEPKDWHQMRNASKDALIVVMASHNYNAEDYIHEPYK